MFQAISHLRASVASASRVASLITKKSATTHSLFFLRCTNATTGQHRFFHVTPQALAKLNVEGLAERVDLKGQNVLVRVDLNVPLAKVRAVIVLQPGFGVGFDSIGI